jgi:hypothetical protein
MDLLIIWNRSMAMKMKITLSREALLTKELKEVNKLLLTTRKERRIDI